MDGLEPAVFCAQTETAQRFLASAYDSVAAMFENVESLRQMRKSEGRGIQGRLPSNEEDLLRAAILFSGAGLDSALKRLIEDALPDLLQASAPAHDKLEAYLAARLKADSAPVKLAKYLLAPAPRDEIIRDYIWSLTGESLQSVDQVHRISASLGLAEQNLRRAITDLKPLFMARNQIAHELDLQRTEKRGDRSRVSRKMSETKTLAHSGLNVAQKIINGVAVVLSAK